MTYEEALLGVGLSIEVKNNKIKHISTPLDLISFFAFEKMTIRYSIYNERFDYFFPLCNFFLK